MKRVIALNLIIFLCLNFSCRAQYLMHNINEAYKIQDNSEQFVGKSLSYLISTIKPPIQMATAEMTSDSPASGYFVFTFNKPEERKQQLEKGHRTVKIVVYLKEPFEWKPKIEGIGLERLVWTTDDEEKYGNLTVMRIRVLNAEIGN